MPACLLALQWRHNEITSLMIAYSSVNSGQIIEYTKAPRRVTGLFCGEFTGDRWIPRTKGQ